MILKITFVDLRLLAAVVRVAVSTHWLPCCQLSSTNGPWAVPSMLVLSQSCAYGSFAVSCGLTTFGSRIEWPNCAMLPEQQRVRLRQVELDGRRVDRP